LKETGNGSDNPAPGATAEAAYLFVDFSNLWYAIRGEATHRGDADRAVRVHAANLRRVLAAGREVADAVLVANRSVPESVLRHFRSGFRVELVESGSITGTEQAADELLQNAMYRTILRAPANGVIVMATGDGAGWSEGRGFGGDGGMSTISSRLVCLECGQPIPDGQRWLCSGRCRAVMRLVRYGRSHPEQGPDPADPDLLNRQRRQAGIVGRFPTYETLVKARHHDHGQCQYHSQKHDTARSTSPGGLPAGHERLMVGSHHLLDRTIASRRRLVDSDALIVVRASADLPRTWQAVSARLRLGYVLCRDA
jgi:hypothetical protein